MGPRRAAVGTWAGLVTLVTIAGNATAAGGGGGLFEASSCISPAVLLVLTLTPAETLVTVGTEWMRSRMGIEKK